MKDNDIHDKLDALGNFFLPIEEFFSGLFGCDTLDIALRWFFAGIIGSYSHLLTIIA